MSRRADPEGIYRARRATILSILTTSGVSVDRAELLVREWEALTRSRTPRPCDVRRPGLSDE